MATDPEAGQDRPQAGDAFQTLTERQQKVWSSGDFNEIARQTMAVAEDLCRAADPQPNQAVLDIACGSGNLALVAARRYCDVTGIDFAANLIERARMRAAAEGLTVDFQVGDAQALPFPDARFDVVTSVFGVMFAPDQEQAAGELLRVCKPGGKIALANWMPAEFGADFFGAHARHAPPPPDMPSPLRWGTEDGIEELLGSGLRSVSHKRIKGYAYYRSLDHAVDLFSAYFGPTLRALDMVEGEEGRRRLLDDIRAVFEKHNKASDGAVAVETEYRQTIAIRR
jgi:SAM-dependent methyltransferase